MDEKLRWATAGETRDMIVRGEVSALEVVEACLARIERFEPLLRAFITVDRDGALRAARAADAALASGASPGPLFGVPVAIKDDLWVKDLPATCGSLVFAKFQPSVDGAIAERLRAAGAIIVGKTNLPEFAAWPRTKSWIAGESANPWDLSRIPGASSGGSAAAVAAGVVPVAIGTDGGGSVRIPAALCGIPALFPSVGRVPGRGSFCCSPTESAGPMARSVADVALVQQVIAGPDPQSPHAMQEPAPDVLAGLEQGVTGLRIGFTPDFGRVPVDPRIAALAETAVQALAGEGAVAGAVQEPVPHPWGDGRMTAPLHQAIADAGDPPRPEGPAPDVGAVEEWLAACAAAGELVFLNPEWQRLIAANAALLTPPQSCVGSVGMAGEGLPSEADLHAALDRAMAGYDVLCTPTMATTAPVAPPGWRSAYSGTYMGTDFTFIANSTGCPAATVPTGLADGLPAALQILGRRGEEALVLRVARAVERALPPLPRPAAVI